jgi:D-inositol-3-phosphate glycosyltransferase
MAGSGIGADVFTRRSSKETPPIVHTRWGRLINLDAGPPIHLPRGQLLAHLPDFMSALLAHLAADPPPGAARGQAEPFAVIHSHYWMSGLLGARLAERLGVPLVASFHTLGLVKGEALLPGDPVEPRVRVDAEHHILDRASAVVVPSPQEADNLARLYERSPSRLWVVPPGVDRDVFHPKSNAEARRGLGLRDERVVLFAGRLEAFKAPDLAIQSMSELLTRAPSLRGRVRLLIVGGMPSDPARAWLKGVAQDAGVADHVEFVPAQSPGDLATFYAAADVVLVPSRSESFGLVALEAQACGTPVVASASGGLPHVVAPQSKESFVEGQDPVRYADTILRILGDEPLADRLRRAGLEHAARFTWEATARRLRDVYEQLVATPRPVPAGI